MGLSHAWGRGTHHLTRQGYRPAPRAHPTNNTTRGTPTRAGARAHTHTQTPTAQPTQHTLNQQHTLKPHAHTRVTNSHNTLHNDVHTANVR